MVPEKWSTIYIIFCHFVIVRFYPTNNLKNENFEKINTTPGDIIILHKRTKNHDHMLHYSWGMTCDRCNFYFSFWAIFCPFIPPNKPKNQKFFKKWKKYLEISFYTCVTKIMITWCMILEIRCMTDRRMEKKSCSYPCLVLNFNLYLQINFAWVCLFLR